MRPRPAFAISRRSGAAGAVFVCMSLILSAFFSWSSLCFSMRSRNAFGGCGAEDLGPSWNGMVKHRSFAAPSSDPCPPSLCVQNPALWVALQAVWWTGAERETHEVVAQGLRWEASGAMSQAVVVALRAPRAAPVRGLASALLKHPLGPLCLELEEVGCPAP
eukprot:CAMPEP_0181498826 /NCGR_PEP_ID=MMETSP1110-20121109/54314_1 /TAXON_ID=174948 /ORGANISM="Symbiodinium sp., Strain CCMP421" /LENGTH=161 /DNA_ID=CAMNT_0023626935 /DNA_START=83 /DNA_END=567 /DNA_ORIENTATION=+